MILLPYGNNIHLLYHISRQVCGIVNIERPIERRISEEVTTIIVNPESVLHVQNDTAVNWS